MDASNRNFLKPKPVLARELLLASGLDETLLDNRVDSLNEVDPPSCRHRTRGVLRGGDRGA